LAFSITRKRKVHPKQDKRGRPRLVPHRPPRRTRAISKAVQDIRLRVRSRAAEAQEKGESRLRALAKARGGKYQVGNLKYGLGQAYVSKLQKAKKGLIQTDSNAMMI
jgi:hypothetical protein